MKSIVYFFPLLLGCTSFDVSITKSRVETKLAATTTRLICVGEALYDCIATDKARGWDVDQLLSENEWTAFPGGAPANVATAFAKLGGSAYFVGCVGEDDENSLQNVFQKSGVDTTFMQTDPDEPTRRVMVTRSATGDRDFGAFWNYRKADAFADAYIRNIDDEVLTDADWIVCGTLTLAFPEASESLRNLIAKRLQNEKKTNLFVDVNWRPVFWKDSTVANSEDEIRDILMKFCSNADALKLTDEEADWLLGISDALENPLSVHECFPNASIVLVTAGEKGASYWIEGSSGFVAPYNVDVIETTGAGDAFSAGFLHKWTDEVKQASDIQKTVNFASAVGALTCTREGAIAAQPTLQEVEDFLNTSS